MSEGVSGLNRPYGPPRTAWPEELRRTVTHRRRLLTLYRLASARRRRFIGLLDGRVVTSSSSPEIAGADLIRFSALTPAETADAA